MKQWDVIIIGGGAAGLMCAATAGKRGRKVLVVDHANKVGKKILMSGGGRCNFTNYYIEASAYLSSNRHFCKSALSRYTQWDFIELVNKHNIPFHEKTLGQLFCDNKSADILNMLLAECEQAGVTIKTHQEILSVEKDAEVFKLRTRESDISSDSLVIATGGLSIPTMGASGFGYRLAEQFGLEILETRPALVPFTLSGKLKNISGELTGIAIPVNIRCGNIAFRESILFTHRGISGPAVLQISNYWQIGQKVVVDFLPELPVFDFLISAREQGTQQQIKTLLSSKLPKRFVSIWLDQLGLNKTLAECSNADIESIEKVFKAWEFVPSGTEGYRTAEVTQGGVSTDKVSSKTFEVSHTSGLYFVGEVLDVTGWLGGYNFQWAWSSGYCAGLYV